MSHYLANLDTVLSDFVNKKIAFLLKYRDGNWYFGGGENLEEQIDKYVLNGLFKLNKDKIKLLSVSQDVTTYVYVVDKEFLSSSIDEVIGHLEDDGLECAREQLEGTSI